MAVTEQSGRVFERERALKRGGPIAAAIRAFTSLIAG